MHDLTNECEDVLFPIIYSSKRVCVAIINVMQLISVGQRSFCCLNHTRKWLGSWHKVTGRQRRLCKEKVWVLIGLCVLVFVITEQQTSVVSGGDRRCLVGGHVSSGNRRVLHQWVISKYRFFHLLAQYFQRRFLSSGNLYYPYLSRELQFDMKHRIWMTSFREC